MKKQDYAGEEPWSERDAERESLDSTPQWCPGCGATAPTVADTDGFLCCSFCGYREGL